MLIKHAIITSFVTILLILGAGLAVAKYRHTMTLEAWLEYVWLISAAAGFIGFLCRGGAASSAQLNATAEVFYTSQNPDDADEAAADDKRAGMAFGMVVMIASIIVFAGSLTALCIYVP